MRRARMASMVGAFGRTMYATACETTAHASQALYVCIPDALSRGRVCNGGAAQGLLMTHVTGNKPSQATESHFATVKREIAKYRLW